MTEKATLRSEARKHRAWIDAATEPPEKAADLFFDIIKPKTDQVIAAYYPVGREFDALYVLERAHEQGITCALPKIEENSRVLKFVKWTPETEMTLGPHNIQTPLTEDELSPDIIIVPLLAFDRQGTRLGQGGGYYDATLAHWRAQKEITAIGMAFSQQAVLFKLPRELHDEPLDWVITPKEAHYFER